MQTYATRSVRLTYSVQTKVQTKIQTTIYYLLQADRHGKWKRILISLALSITIAVECSPPSVKFDCGLLCTAREPLEQTDELFLAQLATNLPCLRHLDDDPLHLTTLGRLCQHQRVHWSKSEFNYGSSACRERSALVLTSCSSLLWQYLWKDAVPHILDLRLPLLLGRLWVTRRTALKSEKTSLSVDTVRSKKPGLGCGPLLPLRLLPFTFSRH